MDLFQNPFYILHATPRDNRQRIVKLAEQRSLELDSSSCTLARADLTNPRKRLAIEIAWLPGLGPKKVTDLLTLLENSIIDLLSLGKFTPVVRANLIASGLTRRSFSSPQDLAAWMLGLAREFEVIDAEDLCVVINEDRIVSGFPEVSDLSLVETVIQERRRYYLQVIKSALDKLPAKDLVKTITIAVESATENGEEHAPILIDDLIDSYEVEAQSFLAQETQNIEVLVEKIRHAADAKKADSILAPMISQLIQVVKNWDVVAQPIQISTKSRGLDHSASNPVAGLVRGLALHLFNEHDNLDFSQQLTNMLQEVFSEVVEIAERTAEDASALDDIAKQRKVDDLLDQISALCNKVFEAAEKNPSAADREAHLVLDSTPQLLSKLYANSVPDEIISKRKNDIALTVMHCAVVYGNKTENWKHCISILGGALRLASGQEVKSRIEKNLRIIQNNDRLLGDLSPISSAPTLHTINGIGFTLYGSADSDPESNSHMSTYYFVFFGIPIFPICRYRVIPTTDGYRFLGKAPLRALDKWHIAISLLLIGWMFFSMQ